MDEQPVGADEFRSRFAALCTGGVGPALPRRRRDAQIFLRGAVACLESGRTYDERSLGEALRRLISSLGPRVDLDHVTLRRYLVDEGFLNRDPEGTAYEVRPAGRGPVPFDPSVDRIDGARLVADLAERARRRSERADATAASGGTAPAEPAGASASGERPAAATLVSIALGSDHAGFMLKSDLIEMLSLRGHRVQDCGTFSEEPVDYPAFVRAAAMAVARGACDRAIVLGGSGNGEAIVANRIRGIRCTLCWNDESARLARAHNDSNVLSLGARLVSPAQARRIVELWLETPFDGGRHARRIAQIDAPSDGG